MKRDEIIGCGSETAAEQAILAGEAYLRRVQAKLVVRTTHNDGEVREVKASGDESPGQTAH